ncbi:MAG: S26 family signal peptidase [Devosia sp.]
MRRILLLLCMGIGLAALCAPSWVQFPVQIVYNPSSSVPLGWYSIRPVGPLHVGGIMLARLPAEAAALAARRRYLPTGIPLLKRIGAVAPQLVCVRGGVVRIDGVVVATTLVHDGQHRPLQAWAQCRRLKQGELFLLSDTNPASFDSRYFGPIQASVVIGSARALWTWGAP